MKLIYFILILLVISCNKYECIKTKQSKMIGEWHYFSEQNGFHTIYIQSNGRGSIRGENIHYGRQDTQSRGWFIKGNKLYFSRFYNKVENENFNIDSYPIQSHELLIIGDDTIKNGESYMILNNLLYKKVN